MKITTVWKALIFALPMIYASSAWSITPDEERFICKKPKFREFVPAHKAEVLPESEISFHISKGASPEHVTLEVKGEKLPVKVIDHKAFLVASAKIPATVRDYARVHVTAKAAEGDCFGSDGWLIRVVEAGQTSASAVVKP